MHTSLEGLCQEHRTIHRVIGVMEQAWGCSRGGHTVPCEPLYGAIEFMTGFVDRCHHQKEERALYALLLSKRPRIAGSPVRALAAEHAEARRYLSALNQALHDLQAGRIGSDAAAAEALHECTQLLRGHLAVEETALFPMCQATLGEDDLTRLGEQFEAIERETMGAGAHDRAQALVDRIEAGLYTRL